MSFSAIFDRLREAAAGAQAPAPTAAPRPASAPPVVTPVAPASASVSAPQTGPATWGGMVPGPANPWTEESLLAYINNRGPAPAAPAGPDYSAVHNLSRDYTNYRSDQMFTNIDTARTTSSSRIAGSGRYELESPPEEGGIKGFIGDLFGKADDATMGVLGGALDVIDTGRAGVMAGFRGGWLQPIPGMSQALWGETKLDPREFYEDTKRNIGAGELVEDAFDHWGVPETEATLWLKRGLGFSGDVLFDPTTWAGGAGVAARGGQMATRTANMARRVANPATREFLEATTQKLVSRGASSLSASEVRRLQALNLIDDATRQLDNAADDVARQGLQDRITSLQAVAETGERTAQWSGRALRRESPEFLRGGVQLNLPGSGRLAQRVGFVDEARTFTALPQGALKFTPVGLVQRAGSAMRGRVSTGTLNAIAGGNYQGLKNIVRNGTAREVTNALLTVQERKLAEAAGRQWLENVTRGALQVIEATTGGSPRAKLKHNAADIMLALQGDAAARAAIGEEAYAVADKWRNAWLETANEMAGYELFARQDNWAPHVWTEDYARYVASKGDDTAARARRWGRKAPLDPEARIATIKPGEKFQGTMIYKATDPRANGLTPRQQAAKIVRDNMANTGKAPFEAIFSDNFMESVIANAAYTMDQIVRAKTINGLVKHGIAVDMTEAWDLARAAEVAKLAKFTKIRDAWTRKFDTDLQAARDEARRKFDDTVIDSEGRLRSLQDQVASAQARSDRYERVFRHFHGQYKRALDDVDALYEEMARATGARIERINKLQIKLRRSIAEVNGTIAVTQRKVGNLRTKISNLEVKYEKAVAAANKKSAAEVADIGRQLDVLNKQLDDAVMELNIYAGAASGAMDSGAAARMSDALDRLDADDVPLRQELEQLRDMGPDGSAMSPTARAERMVEIEGLLSTNRALREELAEQVMSFESLVGEVSELDWTQWYRTQYQDAVRSGRIIGIFGEDISPARAREILTDPVAARGQLAQDLGLQGVPPDTQLLAMLKQLDPAAQIDELTEEIESLKRLAMTPEHVNGTIVNWRTPNTGWAPNSANAYQATDMEHFYGGVHTAATDSVGSRRRLLRGKSNNPERVPRFQLEGTNPRIYYGGIEHVNFDNLEAALGAGIPVHRSWGPEWQEIRSEVYMGKPLKDAVRARFPGKDPLRVVDELLTTPGRVSPTAKRNIAKEGRRYSLAHGYDATAWFRDGEWHVWPHDRRMVKGMTGDLDDATGEVVARASEERAMRLADSLEQMERMHAEGMADLEMLNGRPLSMQVRDWKLDRAKRELEAALDEAIKTKNSAKERATREAREYLDRAFELRDRADQHLQEMQDALADATRQEEARIAAAAADVAALESAAAQAEAHLTKIHGSKWYKKNVRDIDKMIKDIEKNISDEVWEKTIQSGMRRVGDTSAIFMPEDLAEGLAAASKLRRTAVLEHLDAFMTSWKAQATSSGGFHTRNYLGGIMNNLAADINPRRYGQWGKMERLWNERTQGGSNYLTRMGNPGEVDPRDAERWVMEEAARRKIDPRVADAWLQVKRSGIAEGGQFDELGIARTFVEGRGRRRPGENLAQATWRQTSWINPISSDFAPYRTSRNIGGKVEARLRGALAMDVVLKGGTIEEAMERVHRFHFDYDDLSNWERNVGRRGVPFYTWTRKNLPLQLMLLIDSPKAFQRYMAFQRNMEIGTEEEEVTPFFFNHLTAIRTPWMGVDLPGPLRTGERDNGRFYLNPSTPFSNMTETLTPRGILNASAPWIKVPFQLMTGEDSFTGQPYGDSYSKFPSGWDWMRPALEEIGLVSRDVDGDPIVPFGVIDTIRDFSPLLANLARFSSGGERTGAREASSLVSWLFGVGSTVNSPSRIGAEYYRVADEWRSEAVRLQETLGRDHEQTQHAWQQYNAYREMGGELYGYERGD